MYIVCNNDDEVKKWRVGRAKYVNSLTEEGIWDREEEYVVV